MLGRCGGSGQVSAITCYNTTVALFILMFMIFDVSVVPSGTKGQGE